MKIETKEVKNLAGVILLVRVPKEKIKIKSSVFTGKGVCVPSEEAEHVLTKNFWYGEDEERLGVDTTYTEDFAGYLKSSHPESLHPSFKGKSLQQILDCYINNNNNIVNEGEKLISRVLKVGYVPLKDEDGGENDQKDYLFTEPEYTEGQVYLHLNNMLILKNQYSLVVKLF